MAETSFSDLIEEVARRYGKYKKGTVSSDSSTTTLIDEDNLYEPDDYWVGNYVYILSGGPSGEERPITDYDQGDGKCTVSPAFTSSISSNDTYEVLPLSRAELKKAVNSAIRAAGMSWPSINSDTSTITSISSADYDYSIATDTVELLSVSTRHTASGAWQRVPREQYELSGAPGSYTLQFSPLFNPPHGADVRLDYLARPSTMSSDSDTLGLGEPAERECVRFVIQHALFILHDQAAAQAGGGSGFRPHLTQAQYYGEQAEQTRAQAAQWPPRRKEEENGD